MSNLVKDGELTALRAVKTYITKYDTANNVLGHYINQYREACPLGLALGHVLSVNPTLIISPSPTKDNRRGFMYATATMAKHAGVDWKKLDELNTCAYVWGYDINKSAETLYKQYGDLFTLPDNDFWSTTYLLHYLGSTVFNFLWNYRDITKTNIYDSLLYGTENIKQKVGIYTVSNLRKAVLYKSKFVIIMAKKSGKVASDIWFRTPVLTKDNILDIYTGG